VVVAVHGGKRQFVFGVEMADAMSNRCGWPACDVIFLLLEWSR
jgi:hypothetical protein